MNILDSLVQELVRQKHLDTLEMETAKVDGWQKELEQGKVPVDLKEAFANFLEGDTTSCEPSTFSKRGWQIGTEYILKISASRSKSKKRIHLYKVLPVLGEEKYQRKFKELIGEIFNDLGCQAIAQRLTNTKDEKEELLNITVAKFFVMNSKIRLTERIEHPELFRGYLKAIMRSDCINEIDPFRPGGNLRQEERKKRKREKKALENALQKIDFGSPTLNEYAKNYVKGCMLQYIPSSAILGSCQNQAEKERIEQIAQNTILEQEETTRFQILEDIQKKLCSFLGEDGAIIAEGTVQISSLDTCYDVKAKEENQLLYQLDQLEMGRWLFLRKNINEINFGKIKIERKEWAINFVEKCYKLKISFFSMLGNYSLSQEKYEKEKETVQGIVLETILEKHPVTRRQDLKRIRKAIKKYVDKNFASGGLEDAI